jgi:lipid-A-disaccharide synthase-like uncharacterized protein
LKVDTVWLIIGFVGQAAFGLRFFVQWLHSERHGRSLIPIAFWYFSLAGGVILFSYALHRRVIYSRNLHLVYRERRQKVKAE